MSCKVGHWSSTAGGGLCLGRAAAVQLLVPKDSRRQKRGGMEQNPGSPRQRLLLKALCSAGLDTEADGTCFTVGHAMVDRGMGVDRRGQLHILSGYSLGSLNFKIIELVLESSTYAILGLVMPKAGIDVPEEAASSAPSISFRWQESLIWTLCSHLSCPLPIECSLMQITFMSLCFWL